LSKIRLSYTGCLSLSQPAPNPELPERNDHVEGKKPHMSAFNKRNLIDFLVCAKLMEKFQLCDSHGQIFTLFYWVIVTVSAKDKCEHPDLAKSRI
jgi:hypothetical protein